MSRILVVDDEAIITMQLEERLTIMGYTVAGMAASGEDAVDKARRIRPDLVLMDIVMPGKMNGIEAGTIITRELDIPVVFVTAYADDAIIEKPSEYLGKLSRNPDIVSKHDCTGDQIGVKAWVIQKACNARGCSQIAIKTC